MIRMKKRKLKQIVILINLLRNRITFFAFRHHRINIDGITGRRSANTYVRMYIRTHSLIISEVKFSAKLTI